MPRDEAVLMSLVKGAPVGLAVCTADSVVVAANPFLCDMIGLSPDAVVGGKMKDLFDRASWIYFDTQLDQLLISTAGLAKSL